MRFNKYLIFNRFIIMDKIVCRKNGKNNKYKKLILNNNIHLLKVIKLCIDINYYNPQDKDHLDKYLNVWIIKKVSLIINLDKSQIALKMVKYN